MEQKSPSEKRADVTRMSAERLRAIEALRRDNREACHWGHVGDLLEELAAATRERDEARAALNHECYMVDKVRAERDRAEQERDQARAARDAINREYEDCRQLCLKAERERDEAQGWRTIAEQHCRNEEYFRQERDRLREALQFYADEKNYKYDSGAIVDMAPKGMSKKLYSVLDFGERARAALEGK